MEGAEEGSALTLNWTLGLAKDYVGCVHNLSDPSLGMYRYTGTGICVQVYGDSGDSGDFGDSGDCGDSGDSGCTGVRMYGCTVVRV